MKLLKTISRKWLSFCQSIACVGHRKRIGDLQRDLLKTRERLLNQKQENENIESLFLELKKQIDTTYDKAFHFGLEKGWKLRGNMISDIEKIAYETGYSEAEKRIKAVYAKRAENMEKLSTIPVNMKTLIELKQEAKSMILTAERTKDNNKIFGYRKQLEILEKLGASNGAV